MTLVRLDNDSRIHPDTLRAPHQYGELTIDDGTGVVLTTPTNFTDIKGSPMVANLSSGVTLSATDGTFTIARPGVYRVGFTAARVGAVNSQTLEVQAVRNGSALDDGIYSRIVQAATAVITSVPGVWGYVNCSRGDVIKFQAKASTGNASFLNARFLVEQVSDSGNE